jgi:protease II
MYVSTTYDSGTHWERNTKLRIKDTTVLYLDINMDAGHGGVSLKPSKS